jgi:hypothetical protein
MRSVLLSLVILAGCTKVGTESEPSAEPPVAKAEVVKRVDSIPAVSPTPPGPPAPAPAPAPPPKTAPKASARVELTAVTLADDCGGTTPNRAPSVRADESRAKRSQDMEQDSSARGARARQRCEQTSMQLAIMSTDATKIRVKSVRLYDEDGKLVATLTASKPTKWSTSTSMYETWDESVSSGTFNVSYVLSQPSWDRVVDRWNKTFTLKAVVTVGGVDKTAQKDVSLAAPTTLPPNVRT